MKWKIEFDIRVAKDLKKLSHEARERILNFLEEKIETEEDPRRLGEPLTGTLSGLWRYRIGDYRIISLIEDDRFIVLVVRDAHRKEAYRKK